MAKASKNEAKIEIDDAFLKIFEPLPFVDYKLFDEKFDAKKMSIHNNPHALEKNMFVPKQSIQIEITAETKFNMIHVYIYIIKIRHNKIEWEVVRSYKELREVHKKLSKLVKLNLGIAPHNIPKKDIRPDWPLFPLKYDSLIPENKIQIHCNHLATYLERVLTYPPYRDHPSVCSLLTVSPVSFLIGIGPSLVEDLMQKKSGDVRLYGGCIKSRKACQMLKIWHEKRWFCLKDTYLIYMDPKLNFSISSVILVDSKFECEMKIKAGAYHAIEIKNLERRLELKCKNSHQQKLWYDKICEMLRTTGRPFKDISLLAYDSYAPNRSSQLTKWYVNASQYMEHIMMALNGAKEEIYIADWWLCPEIYLKRPTDHLEYRLDKILHKKANEGVKIYILLYKEFTMVLNLMTQRTRQILTEYGSNPNIKILRHPDHFFDGVFLWSHHEKFVVVDQTIGFLSGIDLCYGRWDDENHRLIDLGKKVNITHIEAPTSKPKLVETYSEANLLDENLSILYKNPNKFSQQQLDMLPNSSPSSPDKGDENELKLIRAFTNLDEETITTKKIQTASSQSDMKIAQRATKPITAIRKKFNYNLNKTTTTLRPTRSKQLFTPVNQRLFNKKSETTSVNGEIDAKKTVKWVASKEDMIRNRKLSFNNLFKPSYFKNRSNHQNRTKLNDDIYDRWHSGGRVNDVFIDEEDEQDPRIMNMERIQVAKMTEEDELPKQSDIGYYYWIGKDYANAYVEDFKDIHEHNKDQFDRERVPRMPWRDQGMCIVGHAARDLARHFIQRWNQCKNEQVPLLDTYPYLIPKSYQLDCDINSSSVRKSVEWLLKEENFKCSIQMLRSVDDWSAGISGTECSIQNAYIDLIQNAEHYIYIENQFFVTTTNPAKDVQVKNAIGLAIVERIKQAHINKKKFRVYVVLPLLPGFDRMNAIKAVHYFNLRSIKFGEFSIYKELKRSGINDPSEYITFHGMRNWGVLMGKLVQEIIYVHSKIMIIDDKYVICGSANINDRSMLGKRDSEVAALVKDEEFFDSTLDGKRIKAGRYAFSLRQKIFKLHLGIYFANPNQISVADCVCDEFYHRFKTISHSNTLVYDEVFKCLPSDNMLTFNDLKNRSKQVSLSKTNPAEGKHKMEKFVQGLVVDFPLNFLSKERNFFPDFVTAEGIAPVQFWT